jgi:acetyltransferase-like isoleucine patch superfamily enzyme
MIGRLIAFGGAVVASASERYRAQRNPVTFARSIGVKVGENVNFYGVSRGMFGSEPWLVSIGNNVFITAGVQFLTHDGGTLILRREVPDLEWTAPITIGDWVYIGVRATILPGVRIGDRSIIGACSVVTRDVAGNSVVAGNPARLIRTTDEYLSKMKQKSLRCGHLQGDEKDRYLRQLLQHG